MTSPNFVIQEAATQRILSQMPYAQFIGMEVGVDLTQNWLFKLPFALQNIGNDMVPALHGGLIGGFLESAASSFLVLSNNLDQFPKIIDFSLDYLRPGRPEDTYASCILTRQGRRVVNISAQAWQKDINSPIAVARAHFLALEDL